MESSGARVGRGGAFRSNHQDVRAAYRLLYAPDYRNDYIGPFLNL